MSDCIFCKIINKEMNSEIVFENDNVIVIKDIKPKARIHLLIIPKKHVESVKDLKEEDRLLAGELILTAKKLGEEMNLDGYTLKFHVGRGAGQIVDHIHMHLLSDK
jgi:histidine triad (HIT) family protein